MSLRQAYIAAFYFLDFHYYVEAKNDDLLIDLLSSMNPFFWTDGRPLNSAAENDWAEAAKKITDGELLDVQQAFQVMREYVKFYKTEFGFNYEWVIADITKKTYKTPKWLECVTAAMESPPPSLECVRELWATQ